MTRYYDVHVAPAREVAAEVLVRVFVEKAYAAAALDAELRRRPDLDPRDMALATELVYGVLRTQTALDERIGALAKSRGYASDPRAFAHLLMGAYAICFLDRVPAFAAVSEAVAGVGGATDSRLAGFANAVLRKLAAEVEEKGRPALTAAIAASAPGWLRGSLRRSLGRKGAEAYLAAGPVPPPIGLCLAAGEDRDAWVAKLRAAAPGASIEPGRASPRAILVRGAGDARAPVTMGPQAAPNPRAPRGALPGYEQAWIIQEEGAQCVALAAGVKPGDRVLDACAGRGNKSWIFGQQVGPGGTVDAADLYAAKLEQLRRGPAGKLIRSTFAVDWTEGAGEIPEGYDLVIVDAPCSGIGTLRRRPEIGLTREAEDLGRLADLQTAITRRAASKVREGGRLVYAVCSVLREEGEDVIDRLLKGEEPSLRAAPFAGDFGRTLAGEGHCFRLLPDVHGTDGYFVASLERLRKPAA